MSREEGGLNLEVETVVVFTIITSTNRNECSGDRRKVSSEDDQAVNVWSVLAGWNDHKVLRDLTATGEARRSIVVW